mmetsp:Transcript_23491/g.93123  ORF Transcript_23491/g.93123 Transcript_23491/m.93123 type:complete len:122 (+) Transcript_23491:928-1293(+)
MRDAAFRELYTTDLDLWQLRSFEGPPRCDAVSSEGGPPTSSLRQWAAHQGYNDSLDDLLAEYSAAHDLDDSRRSSAAADAFSRPHTDAAKSGNRRRHRPAVPFQKGVALRGSKKHPSLATA